jgi:subtilisin family serine protease
MIRRFLAAVAIAAMTAVGFAPAASAQVSEPAFNAVNASALWDRGFIGQGSSIAFIDQGVNLSHPYFQGEVIDGYCLYSVRTTNLCPNGQKTQTGVTAASQRVANENHGNMVAGIAAGKPTLDAPGGIAPGAKIVMANIDLTLEGITAAAQYILDRADANNTVALSLSFGGLFQEIPRSWLKCDDNPALAGLAGVFRQLRDKGIITFASAGNTPTLDIATSVFPSCLREVVAVGSVNQLNEISWYVTMSQKIELLAPDYAISANTIGYLTSSGTSAAAPLAAGAFALLRNAFPNASSEQILNAMKSDRHHGG